MKSIVQDLSEERCFLCGSTRDLDLHHIMHGTANRRLATRYGLVCFLCRKHHTGQHGVHADPELNRKLQQVAQMAFEARYSHAKWMRVFMKNYL